MLSGLRKYFAAEYGWGWGCKSDLRPQPSDFRPRPWASGLGPTAPGESARSLRLLLHLLIEQARSLEGRDLKSEVRSRRSKV